MREILLLPYLNSTNLYQCPADREMSVDGGIRARRAFNCGMSHYLNDERGAQKYVQRNGLEAAPHIATKESQIGRPTGTLLFIDEEEESNRGSAFNFLPADASQWLSLPADRHQRGCNLPFADGHVEGWRW